MGLGLIPGDWRQEAVDWIRDIQRVGSNTHSRSAAELRDNLMNYFASPEGAVPWQLNHIRS